MTPSGDFTPRETAVELVKLLFLLVTFAVLFVLYSGV